MAHYAPAPTSNIEWIGLDRNDPTPLLIGETYAFQTYVQRDGQWAYGWTPIKILGKARRGQWGDRVQCDDGINRYTSGPYRGIHRIGQHGNRITHKLNPSYVKPRPPQIQLSFDFEAVVS